MFEHPLVVFLSWSEKIQENPGLQENVAGKPGSRGCWNYIYCIITIYYIYTYTHYIYIYNAYMYTRTHTHYKPCTIYTIHYILYTLYYILYTTCLFLGWIAQIWRFAHFCCRSRRRNRPMMPGTPAISWLHRWPRGARKTPGVLAAKRWGIPWDIPQKMDHRNSGFSHETWWFSIVMLVYQRILVLYL